MDYTMDTASEPGVGGTSFRAIPQSIIIINNPLLSGLYTGELVGRMRNTGIGINANEKKQCVLLYDQMWR